jgi:hypothetical protein
MARYFFHVERGSVVSPDNIGLLLPNAGVAVAEGAKAVKDMLHDAKISGELLSDIRLKIVEENGDHIHTFDLAA